MSTEERLGKVEEAIRELRDIFREHVGSTQVGRLEAAFGEFKSSTFSEFKSTMRNRFDSMANNIADLKKLINSAVHVGMGVVGSLWVAIAFLFFQINNVDKKVTPIGGTLERVEGSLKTISDAVVALKASRGTGLAAPQTSPAISPALDDVQKDLLQSGVKVWPAADKLTVGEVVSNPDVLVSVPEDVANAIPALRGALYTIGRTSILFVDRADHRVFAVAHKRG
jgi:hypothetical protein